MKTYELRGRQIPYYVTLSDMITKIQNYCQWGHFESDHNPDDYKVGKYGIYYWNFHYAERDLQMKSKYRFIKAKVKQLIEEYYVDVVVGNNYGVQLDKIKYIIHDYLTLTKQIKDED